MDSIDNQHSFDLFMEIGGIGETPLRTRENAWKTKNDSKKKDHYGRCKNLRRQRYYEFVTGMDDHLITSSGVRWLAVVFAVLYHIGGKNRS